MNKYEYWEKLVTENKFLFLEQEKVTLKTSTIRSIVFNGIDECCQSKSKSYRDPKVVKDIMDIFQTGVKK